MKKAVGTEKKRALRDLINLEKNLLFFLSALDQAYLYFANSAFFFTNDSFDNREALAFIKSEHKHPLHFARF
jgi:hypothetical protein